jgi:Tetratricopeptide repeat
MRLSIPVIAVTLALAMTLSTPAVVWARGGGGGGGHGGGGGGGGGHFAGGYRGGGARYGGWAGRGYGWGYPYYGAGLGLGLGLGYGLGYGGYGGWGYGYPNYGYYGYSPYGGGYAPGYSVPYAAAAPNNSPPIATVSAASPPPPTGAASDSARDFADKGDTAFKAADYPGAAYAFRHALIDDPHNGVVTLLLGQALFASGNYAEAAGATQAALRQLPRERWGIVVSHYQDLYGNTQDYTRQLRALEAELKSHPSDPALRFLAGYHYGFLGFRSQALDQLEKGVSLAPRDEVTRELRDELRNTTQASKEPPPAPRAPFFNYEEN